MITSCNCKNEGQDKLNGKGNRVFNPTMKKPADSKKVVYRCSVCAANKEA